MSRLRTRPQPPFDARHCSDWRGAEGRRCCRWCGVEVPSGRRSWCSGACVLAYADTDPAGFRAKVLERDGGTCASCDLQCADLDTHHAPVRPTWPEPAALGDCWVQDRRSRLLWRAWRKEERAAIREWWRARGFKAFQSAWEADHVVPLCEGGADTVENLRTLCVPCHKCETAALASRRAARRWARGVSG